MPSIDVPFADNSRIQLTALEREPLEAQHQLQRRHPSPAGVGHQRRLGQVPFGHRFAGDGRRLMRDHSNRMSAEHHTDRRIAVRAMILGAGYSRRGSDERSGQ
jgi:hypothetical protein